MSDYQHRPDQGPGGDKQFLMYMMLAFVMVLLLQGIFFKQPPKPASQAGQPPAAQEQAPAPAPGANSKTAAVRSAAGATTQPLPPIEGKHASSEGEIVVEDDLFRVVLTNRGGQAKSWVLKSYKNEKGDPL